MEAFAPTPPATSALPSGRGSAECWVRAVIMGPVRSQRPRTKLYSSAEPKGFAVLERPPACMRPGTADSVPDSVRGCTVCVFLRHGLGMLRVLAC